MVRTVTATLTERRRQSRSTKPNYGAGPETARPAIGVERRKPAARKATSEGQVAPVRLDHGSDCGQSPTPDSPRLRSPVEKSAFVNRMGPYVPSYQSQSAKALLPLLPAGLGRRMNLGTSGIDESAINEKPTATPPHRLIKGHMLANLMAIIAKP